MANDFNWNDREDVVVQSVQAVAVYMNVNGEVVIRQEDPMGNEDAIIAVPRAQARALAKAITEAAKKDFNPQVDH
jgi:hypothetical protein